MGCACFGGKKKRQAKDTYTYADITSAKVLKKEDDVADQKVRPFLDLTCICSAHPVLIHIHKRMDVCCHCHC